MHTCPRTLAQEACMLGGGRPQQRQASRALPEGWAELVDRDGQAFYVHERDQRVTCTHPLDLPTREARPEAPSYIVVPSWEASLAHVPRHQTPPSERTNTAAAGPVEAQLSPRPTTPPSPAYVPRTPPVSCGCRACRRRFDEMDDVRPVGDAHRPHTPDNPPLPTDKAPASRSVPAREKSRRRAPESTFLRHVEHLPPGIILGGSKSIVEEMAKFAISLERGKQGMLGITILLKGDKVLIHELSPGEPAAKSRQLCRGDEILEINGKSVSGLSLRQVLAGLQGRPGSRVDLSVSGLRRDFVHELDISAVRGRDGGVGLVFSRPQGSGAVQIAARDVCKMSILEITAALRGLPGSRVLLKVRRKTSAPMHHHGSAHVSSKCGALNKPKYSFCDSCGQAVSDGADAGAETEQGDLDLGRSGSGPGSISPAPSL